MDILKKIALVVLATISFASCIVVQPPHSYYHGHRGHYHHHYHRW